MSEDSSIRIYTNDIRRFSILIKEEEMALVKRIQKGDQEAVNLLVSSNLPFVMFMIKRYTGKGIATADLIQEGNLGLISAAKTFNLKKKVRFLSYARWAIKSRIVDAFYYTSRLIRVPKHQQLARNKDKFSVPFYFYFNKLNPLLETDDEFQLSDETSLTSFNEVENVDFNNKLKIQLHKSLKRLDKRGSYVLRSSYGIDGTPKKNYRELANEM